MIQNLFYFLSFLAIFSGLMVVSTKNPVHSVLYLILTFFAIAGHYILMNAQFLAVVHIIVYAGAIMVLFLFVIMLLNLNKKLEPQKSTLLKGVAVIASGSLLLILVASFKQLDNIAMVNMTPTNIGLVENLGMVLFKEYILPFEMASILLLSAMVGSVLLAKKDKI